MEAVWPVIGLRFGPAAVWPTTGSGGRTAADGSPNTAASSPRTSPHWAAVAIGASHCGADCTLGDIVAGFVVFRLAVTLAGQALYAEYSGGYLAAVGLGIVFQYFAIAPMRGLGVRKGLVEAAKADVLSLTSLEVGLFGWMTLMSLMFFPHPHLRPDSPVYWSLMQIGMIAGFFTAWPANVWPPGRGIKETM
jgi:hypothetical protein